MHKFLVVFSFIACLFSPFACSHQYAPKDISDKLYQTQTKTSFSNVYPDLATKEAFKGFTNKAPADITSLLATHKNISITKICPITKELAVLAFVFENYKNKTIEDNVINMFQFDNINIDSLENNVTYEGIMEWFYKKNFDDNFSNIRYESEKYLYKIIKDDLKLLNKRQKLAINYYQFRKEDEEAILTYLLERVKNKLPKNLGDLDTSDIARIEHDGAMVGLFTFLKAQHPDAQNFSKKIDEKKTEPILLQELNRQRQDTYSKSFHLYRSTKPFLKDNQQIYDDLIRSDKDGKYVSLSFATSLFSHLLADPGATPLSYWTNEQKMQYWEIPYEDLRKIIKDRLLFVRPYFGLTGLFFGYGEWHERSTLPKEAFSNNQLDPNKFWGGSGGHELDKSWAYLFLNSNKSFKDFKMLWNNLEQFRSFL